MKRTRFTAAVTCAAILLTTAAFPVNTMISAEETTEAATEERFGHYGSLTYEIMEDGLKIISCEADAVSAEIPPEIDGVPVISVASNAFGANDALESVVWNTTARVPMGLFKGTGLKTLTIGEAVEDNSCDNLIDGCEHVHVIFDKRYAGEMNFNHCEAITEVTFTDKVEYSYTAFNDCPNLRSVQIGAGLAFFDSDSFLRCPALKEFTVSAENENLSSADGCVYSKDGTELVRYPAAMAADSFTVPDSAERISRNAFYGAQLREVFLPDTLINVGESAFAYADTLEAIHVPGTSGNYCTEDGVLYDMRYRILIQYPCGKKDIEFTVHDWANAVGMHAFTGNDHLQRIIMPDSVKEIYDGAFMDCQGLKYAYLPTQTDFLGTGIFELCEHLLTVTFPENIDTIPDSMFFGCSSLREVALPETVRNVENGAFSHCSSLWTIDLPETMDSLGWYSFSYCTNLRTFAVPEGITQIDSTFSYDMALEKLFLPASLETIRSNTLMEELPLTDVYYAGTQEQWEAVIVEENNPALDGVEIHFGCTEVEPPAAPTGDLNEDGQCNLQDALTLQVYLLGHPILMTEQMLYDADMAQDGIVDGFDLAVMKRHILLDR